MLARTVFLFCLIVLPAHGYAADIPMAPRAPLDSYMGQHAGPHTGEHPPMEYGTHMGAAVSVNAPVEAGQSAFAAIQEIVERLDADPATDWSRVNIDALRAHLVDMDNVTLRARVAAEPVPGGLKFVVTGDGGVQDSIRRMVSAHARTMDGVGGFHMTAVPQPDGAVLTVTADDEPRRAKLKGLGFFGLMAFGMHHQAHHLALATGRDPHAH